MSKATLKSPVKRKRAHHINTGRLVGRRMLLVCIIRCNKWTHELDGRPDFAVRVAELQAIENVLVGRGVLKREQRVTTDHTRADRFA